MITYNTLNLKFKKNNKNYLPNKKLLVIKITTIIVKIYHKFNQKKKEKYLHKNQITVLNRICPAINIRVMIKE